MASQRFLVWFSLAASLTLSGCTESAGNSDVDCDLDDSLIRRGAGVEGIPALTFPDMVPPEDPLAAYLEEDDRVLGVVVNGVARAYPHNVLWWHEIVNDSIGGTIMAITFCPLTGSGLVFHTWADTLRGAPEFGVSGLLYANNLIMYDRQTGSLYGPQLEVTGRCDLFNGEPLPLYPVLETSWRRWKELYPITTVVGSETGHSRDYRLYPYGPYDQVGNNQLLYNQPVDPSRPLKERVLGIRIGDDAGRGYPFSELAALGSRAAVHEDIGGVPIAVFWDEADGQNAVAYESLLNDMPLSFTAEAGGWRDAETGSLWDLAGRAVEGPLTGERLTPVADAYVAFWFAWRFFQTDATIFDVFNVS